MVVSTSAKDWWIVHVGLPLPGTEWKRNEKKSEKQNCKGKARSEEYERWLRRNEGGNISTAFHWLSYLHSLWHRGNGNSEVIILLTCHSAESVSNCRVKFWLHWSGKTPVDLNEVQILWIPNRRANGHSGGCAVSMTARLQQDLKSFSSAQFPEIYEGFEHPLMLQITYIPSQKLVNKKV